jgi:hypothetical protein
LGFWGIRLHPTFLPLHRSHGPSGSTIQASPASLHQMHCRHLLAPRPLRGQRHT